MTLKPIESEFSEILQERLKHPETSFNLSLSGEIVGPLHPKIVWKQLELKHNPQQEVIPMTLSGWFWDSAWTKYPELNQEPGRPWNVFRFMTSSAEKMIFHFPPLGSVVLSKVPLENTQQDHCLPLWLSYALSPELWGPQGKWPRFHSRLQKLFQSKELLNEGDYPGHYPLKKEAKKLEAFGFLGEDLEEAYVLVLPWTFPLTALEKLEQVVQQEF